MAINSGYKYPKKVNTKQAFAVFQDFVFGRICKVARIIADFVVAETIQA